MNKSIAARHSLAHKAFETVPLHIPDGLGGAYKTELVLQRTVNAVVKINWWHGPDPRLDPHNHPWRFTSKILQGGYTETRWYGVYRNGQVIDYIKDTRSYKAGDVNVLNPDTFHTIDSVIPGTVTHMVTGPVDGDGDWGYLINKKYVSAAHDPKKNLKFWTQLCELNPHKRLSE